MGKWNASAEGCHAGGIYLLLYQHWFLFTSLHFCIFLLFHSRVSLSLSLSLLHFFPIPPFYSFSFLCTFIFPPSFLPSHLWVYMKSSIYNNSNYLHNDLQVTKHFQIHFLFSFGWWDNRVQRVGLGCCCLQILKLGLREVEQFAQGWMSK